MLPDTHIKAVPLNIPLIFLLPELQSRIITAGLPHRKRGLFIRRCVSYFYWLMNPRRMRPKLLRCLPLVILAAIAVSASAAENPFAEFVRKTEPLTPEQEQK